MIVYAVARWWDYYPSPDNVSQVFTSKIAANKHLEWLLEDDKRRGYSYDRYEIFSYEVQV